MAGSSTPISEALHMQRPGDNIAACTAILFPFRGELTVLVGVPPPLQRSDHQSNSCSERQDFASRETSACLLSNHETSHLMGPESVVSRLASPDALSGRLSVHASRGTTVGRHPLTKLIYAVRTSQGEWYSSPVWTAVSDWKRKQHTEIVEFYDEGTHHIYYSCACSH